MKALKPLLTILSILAIVVAATLNYGGVKDDVETLKTDVKILKADVDTINVIGKIRDQKISMTMRKATQAKQNSDLALQTTQDNTRIMAQNQQEVIDALNDINKTFAVKDEREKALVKAIEKIEKSITDINDKLYEMRKQ